MMIRSLAGLAAIALVVVHGSQSFAQELVTDPPVETSTGTIADDSDQIQTNTGSTATATQNTYTMLTTPPALVQSMFADQDQGTQLNPMPTSTQVLANINYKTPNSTQTGQTIYTQNNTDLTGTDPESTNLKNTIITSTNIQGMAIDNLTALQNRLAEITGMSQKLATASSITQVAAITGRIALETLAVQAQEAQAANLNALATAQNELNLTNREQAIRQEHQQTAALFSVGG